jgi:hypothetical protein
MRIAASVPLFALAVFFALRCWYPIRDGFFVYNDNPRGEYLTVAATGGAIAAMFATAGLLIAWRDFWKYGGFLVVAVAAVVASVLPYLLFNYIGVPNEYYRYGKWPPWAFFIQDRIAWLHFALRPRSTGIKIQIGLAVVAAVAVAAQLIVLTRARPVAATSPPARRSRARRPRHS